MKALIGNSVVFWYLDIDILNKHYGGALNSLNEIGKYPGVRRVDILPIEEPRTSLMGTSEKFGNTLAFLMKYINGV